MDQQEKDLSEQVRVRFEKLARLQEKKENPYKNAYQPSALAGDLHRSYDEKSKEELEGLALKFSVAGRIMAIRDFGKACFVRVKDRTGLIQLYVQKERLGAEAYVEFKEWDVGDLIFSEGQAFKTKTGELSISSEKIVLLTKSLRPLPEKFHGIADIEIKYRQRYLDLIMSEETREVFRRRSKVIETMRQFFVNLGFMEVETPMMHPVSGGATARPFVTHHNTLDMQLFMRIAPELYLKRLLVGGFDRVFEINRNFRNEGISIKHNPEFTMLEFYQAYATYEDLMDLTETLFQTLSQELFEKQEITYQGTEISFKGPWQRLAVEDAILKYSAFQNRSQLRDRRGHGGMLLADSICASRAFSESFRREMSAISPDRKLERISVSDSLLSTTYGGSDLRTVSCLDSEATDPGKPLKAAIHKVPPTLEGIKFGGRWGVVFSPYDLSCALEKQNTLECRGYTREDAARIGLNVLLYSLQQ